MLLDRRRVWALAGATMIAASMNAGAEGRGDASARPDRVNASGPSQPESTGRVLTGKERLGDKASDDQRVDNCKVPPEKRGPKPRPDSCDRDEGR